MGCCCCNCPSDFGNVTVEFEGVTGCSCINSDEGRSSFSVSLTGVNTSFTCLPDGGISGVWRYSFPGDTVIGSSTGYNDYDCACDPNTPPEDCPVTGNICGATFNGVLVQCFDGIWSVAFNTGACADGSVTGLVFSAGGVCFVNGEVVPNGLVGDCIPGLLGYGGTATITW